MAKQIRFSDDVRHRLMNGIEKLSNAVKITMGAKGRNVLLGNQLGGTITNDGVTIARDISLDDAYENLGAQLVKQVAIKTNDIAGDGTTTAIVLADAMISEGIRNITAGANPMEIKEGIRMGIELAVEELKKMARDVNTKNDIKRVATVSAQSEDVGKLISELEEQVKNGVITIGDNPKPGLDKKIVEGMQFDSGFLSMHMITDPQKMEAILENPRVLVYDGKLTVPTQFVHVLEGLAKQGCKNLVIIAEDVEGDALATLVVNKMKGTFNSIAIKSPGSENRQALLMDIAVLTGATVISEEIGLKAEDITLEHLGTAKKVISTVDSTTIVDGGGDKEAIKVRISEIDTLLKDEKDEYTKERLSSRKAKLSGGVAVILVGASTDIELREKKHRIEDALNATRAAVAEGVVAGGGLALVKVRQLMAEKKIPEGDLGVGYKIVLKALESPAHQIATNAGLDGGVILSKMKDDNDFGFDVDKMEWVDMFESGIVDPVKVTRSALENASSLAGTFLTAECAIIDKEEESNKQS